MNESGKGRIHLKHYTVQRPCLADALSKTRRDTHKHTTSFTQLAGWETGITEKLFFPLQQGQQKQRRGTTSCKEPRSWAMRLLRPENERPPARASYRMIPVGTKAIRHQLPPIKNNQRNRQEPTSLCEDKLPTTRSRFLCSS